MRNEIKAIAAAVLSGLLLTAAFPKIDFDWLAWLALVPLIWILNDIRPGEAFRRGLLTGIVHYLSLLYWLVPTMVIYGHLPSPLAVGILFLFAAGLSFLTLAPMTLIFNLLGRTPGRVLLFFPVTWIAAEFLRSFLFTGFPWELLGYSQYRRLNLIQISDIVGVYGVSALIALANAALFLGLLFLLGLRWYGRPVKGRVVLGGLLAAVVAIALSLGYGELRIQQIDRLAQAAPKARIAVVQGNIEQSLKWDPAFQFATIDTYVRLSLSTRPQRPDLIIWPESAAPFYFMAEIPPTRAVMEGVAAAGTDFLIGAPSFRMKGNEAEYFNSAFMVGPGGDLLGKYDKAHLVPFGEYTPYKRYLPFLGKIVEHVGDFVAGPEGRTLAWRGRRLGVLICYESIFPELSRAAVRNGAVLLANITNDAWYGKTAGPYQHYSFAVLRAVENRRAFARAANTGISGFIDPVGRRLEATQLMEEAAVVRELPMLETLTVYTRRGDVLGAGCLAVAFAGAVFGLWGLRRRGSRYNL
jgi:apolipoprotein N-acyltransferase